VRDFDAVTDEVYRLYREGRYRKGAALVPVDGQGFVVAEMDARS
jgi:hypothetical protein